MPEQPDLISSLERAAVDALRSQRRSLDVDRGQIRSVVLEITLRPNGTRTPTVRETDCFVQRRVTVGDVLGVRG